MLGDNYKRFFVGIVQCELCFQRSKLGCTYKTTEHETAKTQTGKSTKRQTHKTAEGTKRQKLKTAESQNGIRHKAAEGTKRQKLHSADALQIFMHIRS
jgi:hypothetical protein